MSGATYYLMALKGHLKIAIILYIFFLFREINSYLHC